MRTEAKSIDREFIEAVVESRVPQFLSERLGVGSCNPDALWIIEETARILKARFPTPEYPRCKTCRWWRGPTGDPGLHQGGCSNPHNNGEHDDPSGSSGSGRECIFTGPDFGCVHHEAREEKPASSSSTEAVEKLKAVAEAASHLLKTKGGESYTERDARWVLRRELKAAGYDV